MDGWEAGWALRHKGCGDTWDYIPGLLPPQLPVIAVHGSTSSLPELDLEAEPLPGC